MGAGGSTPTTLPTVPPIPTPDIATQVQAVAAHGPAWMDSCPLHTGRLPASFYLTSYPGTVQASGYCTTFVQRGPHGDLITYRAEWTAPQKYGGDGRYTLTYLMPRTADPADTLPKLVGQTGTPP
jgi:hypothetical protein